MGIKEKILKHLKLTGFITQQKACEMFYTTNTGEYISRLRKTHNIDCVMCINSTTGREYGVYVYNGKK